MQKNNILIPSLLISVNLLGLINYLEKYKDGAKQIISQITSNVNFKSQLGIQHEIQEEVKYLLNVWIPDKEIGKKRVLIFVDDIDRCSEDKIIQIVDYIRVLLNDDEIQCRVTVLAAIDERILIHAIYSKYKRFFEGKDDDSIYELCREYMDKLFLAGLKLGPLTEFEKVQVLKGFTDLYLKKEKTSLADQKAEIKEDKEPEVPLNTLIAGIPITPPGTISEPDFSEFSDISTTEDSTQSDSEIVNGKDKNDDINYSLEQWEQDFLKEIMGFNSDATPRSIRVFAHRYLLGKKLIEKPLTEEKLSWKQWYNGKDAKKCFALKLFHYTNKSNVNELNSKYREFMKNYKDDNQINEKIYDFSLSLNQELGSIMYQTLTMIVAY